MQYKDIRVPLLYTEKIRILESMYLPTHEEAKEERWGEGRRVFQDKETKNVITIKSPATSTVLKLL